MKRGPTHLRVYLLSKNESVAEEVLTKCVVLLDSARGDPKGNNCNALMMRCKHPVPFHRCD